VIDGVLTCRASPAFRHIAVAVPFAVSTVHSPDAVFIRAALSNRPKNYLHICAALRTTPCNAGSRSHSPGLTETS